MIRTLFQVEWRQFRNKWAQRDQTKILYLSVISTFGLLALCLLIFGARVLGHFASPQEAAPVLSLFFLAGIAAILLFGIPQVFRDLFSASDLELLFTLPIPTRSIFWVKYAQSFLGIAGGVWIFTFIPLIVYGIGAGCFWLYYPAVFFVSAGLTVTAVSITYLFNLGLIQILPTSRAKELMTVMSALAGLAIYTMFQIPNLAAQNGNLSFEDLTSFSGLPAWLPTSLAAVGLTRAGNGDVSALLPTALVVLIAVFLAFLSSTLVERGFRTGWIRLSEGGKKKKTGRKKQGVPPLRHPVIFLGIKEWRSIQRDIREWMMLLPSLVFMFFPMYTIFFSDGDRPKNPLTIWLIIQGGLLFFFSMFSSQLTVASVGREGKAAWILRVLPLSGWQIALGKYWIGWLIPLIVYSVVEIILGVIFTWSVWLILLGIVIFAVMSLGMNGIGLWIGTIAAKYNPNNPQDRVAGGSRFLIALLNILYLVVSAVPGAAILLPLAGIFGNGLLVFFGILGLVVLSLGVASVTLIQSAKRFDDGVHIEIAQGTGGKGLMRSPLSRRKL